MRRALGCRAARRHRRRRLLVLRQRGWGPFEVNYLSKAATFNLLYAFPLLLLAQGDSGWAQVAQPFAYAFTAWGGALYLWSALLYVYQFFLALRVTPEKAA